MTNPVEYLIVNYEASNYSFVSEDTVKFRSDLDAALGFVREKTLQYHGLKQEKTLRDYFAAKAMQGIQTSAPSTNYKNIAKHAYLIADEMMESRK